MAAGPLSSESVLFDPNISPGTGDVDPLPDPADWSFKSGEAGALGLSGSTGHGDAVTI
jgi:hypothetical protein